MRGVVLCLMLGLGLSAPYAAAQTAADDRDYLTAFLEDNLSEAGRKVTILGFRGALSSVAALDEMTIADDDGVWITLRDVSLNWSRSDLLSGAITVNALTAGEVILDRLPVTGDASGLPAAEGAPFTLPELPVSVNIGQLAIDQITLGEAVLGEVITGSASASVSLANGEGTAVLNLDRSDSGPDGYLALEVGYSNASTILTVSLDAQEEAGGVAVRLMSVPGAPSAGLTIEGSGPLDDFVAKVTLATDDTPRLSGDVTLLGNAEGRRDFTADLSGDLAPVFWPEYREFLGNSLTLGMTGATLPDGRMELSSLILNAGALRAKGSLALAADGLPERFDLGLSVSSPDASPLLLPLTTEVQTRITAASLNLGFDASDGEDWTIGGLISGLDRADFKAESLSLAGGGTIERFPEGALISADLSFIALGLAATDPALAAALGKTATGKLSAQWQAGSGKTRITDLSLTGDDYGFGATATIGGLATGFGIEGTADGRWNDLSRLSGLSGLTLGGAADLSVSGTASALGDAFDLRLKAKGEDLTVGQPEIDNLLSGTAEITADVVRNASGTVVRALNVQAGDVTARVTGAITSLTTNLNGTLSLPNLAVLGPRYRGRITGQAAYSGTMTDGQFTLTGNADGLGIGQVQVDRVLAGPADLSVIVAVQDGRPVLQDARLNGQSLDLSATGQPDGTTQLEARLANFGLILPKFPGPLTVSGPIRQTVDGMTLALQANGPAQVSGSLTGRIATDLANADLAFVGQSAADVVNPFLTPRALSGSLAYDLRLSGPLTRRSLSGTVNLSNGRLADPALNFGIEAINGQARLAAGQAQITATAQVTSGGSLTVEGQTGIDLPFPGNLTVQVQNVVFRDPKLYDTTANGALTIDGALAGGALVSGNIALGRTELRIPSSGLGGSEPIPDITHRFDSSDVRETRARAGLGKATAEARSPGAGTYALDIKVTAPNQIFLRGRGLDAELGGSLRLRGTTSDLAPEGSFDLIRGRLDIVGRRLVLSEAQLLLEGAFVPRINIVATTEGDDIISTLRISGPASEPVISFESSPELPEEEVLAQLLFGERLQSLSAFQAVQLASAIRTLAGRGGEGLIGKLRKTTGLDNLDIEADDTGNFGLTAGKYLSEKVYTEVTVDQSGKTQIDLNLDIKSHITLKATASSDGDTGVGVFLEKNY